MWQKQRHSEPQTEWTQVQLKLVKKNKYIKLHTVFTGIYFVVICGIIVFHHLLYSTLHYYHFIAKTCYIHIFSFSIVSPPQIKLTDLKTAVISSSIYVGSPIYLCMRYIRIDITMNSHFVFKEEMWKSTYKLNQFTRSAKPNISQQNFKNHSVHLL